MSWHDPIQVREVAFERKLLGLRVHEDYAIAGGIQHEAVLDHMRRAVEHQFRASIASRHLKAIECECPATWWQHFRMRFFPGWWLRRFPVRMRRVVLTAEEVAPQLALPETGRASFAWLEARRESD